MAEAVQALQLPETYLGAERAARAVTVADRITQRLGPEVLGGEEEEEENKAPTTIASDGPPPHKWGGREE